MAGLNFNFDTVDFMKMIPTIGTGMAQVAAINETKKQNKIDNNFKTMAFNNAVRQSQNKRKKTLSYNAQMANDIHNVHYKYNPEDMKSIG